MEQCVRAASYPKPIRRNPLGLLIGLVLLSACQTTPVTGRRAFNVFTTADDLELGREAYGQVLEGSEPVSSGPKKAMVEEVMSRLAAVADDPGFEWEVNLLRDDATVNAFALPGGKMAVYTGILPVCEGRNGLAVVMGHEIGHVVARHGTERMTSTLGSSMGLDVLLGLLDLHEYSQLAQLGLDLSLNLPFSRSHESEADAIGLVYMARAGFDPREAVEFWSRMEALGGSAGPEFLSTHPSHATRIEDLRKRMPEALEIWMATTGGTPREEERTP